MSSPPRAALAVACAAVLTTVASVAVAWSLRPPDQPDAEVTVCLVRGAAGGEVRGEVIVRRSGAWTRAQVPYLSSGAHLALADVDRDAAADVVAVQRACPGVDDCGRRFAQVFSVVGGGEVGCTAVVGSPEELPGWPEVVPDASTLMRCGP
ncbi:hypothetical protein [Saccharothrix longispora]|uniref:hypothetical protein n=1 Tax=Saccharothrix longispora TaxID=33920 RepID=UPI0028FD7DBC|nr:hypothetical protein [Saccharothrix longispora]MDU0292188.1 hypothetical protein [Saccharothrix longispora]